VKNFFEKLFLCSRSLPPKTKFFKWFLGIVHHYFGSGCTFIWFLNPDPHSEWNIFAKTLAKTKKFCKLFCEKLIKTSRKYENENFRFNPTQHWSRMTLTAAMLTTTMLTTAMLTTAMLTTGMPDWSGMTTGDWSTGAA
jgi:hypothetical protein